MSTHGVLLVAAVLWLAGCDKDAANRNVLAPDPGSGVAAQDPTAMPMHGGDDDDDGRGGGREFDPEDFVRHVDNPYFPLVPRTEFKYVAETEDGREINTVTVTRNTKRILGVTATVVRDRVFVDGELKEDTFDWYAQDEDGNVWYLGEDTKEYEDGVVVSTEGSWLAGKNGARPGIIMLAHPRPGDFYKQEVAPGVAEDQARVIHLDRTVTVPYGTFRHCLQTFETTPLDATAREDKYYAPGLGQVLTVSRTSGERTELKSVTRR
jgi:hypothetical protein